MGNIVEMTARITEVYIASMKVKSFVYAQDIETRQKRLCCSAFLVFVALDEKLKKTPVPKVDEAFKDVEELEIEICRS